MKDKVVTVDGRKLKLTNLEKVYWPELKITKGELLAYYNSVAPFILPHLKDRPQALNRFPDGITGESFFQKSLEKHPGWIEIFKEKTEESEKEVHYPICNDRATLLYLVNLGCIELNVWNSRKMEPKHPDFMVFDLDPVEIDFKSVAEAALEIKKILDFIKVPSFLKTSGKRGLHVYVPLLPRYSFEQVRDFAFLVAVRVNGKLPKTTSLERRPEMRQGKVYLDYLQNRQGATMAAPYCVRPVPKATVSTPISWEELEKGANSGDFTIKNLPKRLEKIGDIFAGTLKNGADLEDALILLK